VISSFIWSIIRQNAVIPGRIDKLPAAYTSKLLEVDYTKNKSDADLFLVNFGIGDDIFAPLLVI
jgi:hypothetical protein